MTEPTLASAVILPEPLPFPPRSSLKRSISEEQQDGASPKRQRKSQSPLPNHNEAPKSGRETNPTTNGSSGPADTRPKSTTHRKDSIDERKRSQRLFGGLLGTLSQKPSNTAAQKRRAELEERRREEAQKREAEAEERGKERLARLAIVRKKEQQRIDENDMRIRHANMLAMARFLSTKAEPKICYKPWEMTSEEQEMIRRQCEATESIVDREVEIFEEKRRLWRVEDKASHDSTAAAHNGSTGDENTLTGQEEANGSAHNVQDAQTSPDESTKSVPVDELGPTRSGKADQESTLLDSDSNGNGHQPERGEDQDGPHTEKTRNPDEAGDAVVDAGEDTVMY